MIIHETKRFVYDKLHNGRVEKLRITKYGKRVIVDCSFFAEKIMTYVSNDSDGYKYVDYFKDLYFSHIEPDGSNLKITELIGNKVLKVMIHKP